MPIAIDDRMTATNALNNIRSRSNLSSPGQRDPRSRLSRFQFRVTSEERHDILQKDPERRCRRNACDERRCNNRIRPRPEKLQSAGRNLPGPARPRRRRAAVGTDHDQLQLVHDQNRILSLQDVFTGFKSIKTGYKWTKVGFKWKKIPVYKKVPTFKKIAKYKDVKVKHTKSGKSRMNQGQGRRRLHHGFGVRRDHGLGPQGNGARQSAALALAGRA
jgi:hypothetical protein